MQLDKTRAIIIGILTLLPHVFGIFALLRVLSFILTFDINSTNISVPSISSLLFGSAFTWLLSMALIVFYLLHVYESKELDTEKKWLWSAVIVFAGYVSMPFYWWYKIWKPATAPVPVIEGESIVPPPEPPEEDERKGRVYEL
ncbi:MAG: hypothetical protein KC994_13470 [Candidatus Omnitrophica bacterium]|nr:hypothetical protein [Candidatus Omnitrophota bacterium]